MNVINSKGSISASHDGYDQWKTFEGEDVNPRTEILLNINDSGRQKKEALIAVINSARYKLVQEGN